MANTELSGVQAFSVYDPSTGTTVQVDGKYVETFDFTQERGGSEGPESPTGANVSAGDMSEVEIVFTDVAGRSQLDTWKSNDTPVSLVAAGEASAIQWYETDIISELEEQPVYDEHATLNRVRLRMVREGHGTHKIYHGTNLLRVANHQVGSTYLNDSWQDSDNDGVADGYNEIAGGSNLSFSSNEQSIDTPSSGFVDFQTTDNLQFPIDGIALKLSINYTQVHSSDPVRVRLEEEDFGGSTLSTSDNSTSSTGRLSTSLTTSSNVYDLLPKVMWAGFSSTETIKAEDPALRLDSSDQYAEY